MYWTWQFVVIRVLCSVLIIVLSLLEIYPVWLSLKFFAIFSVSLSAAFYTVLVFFIAYKEDFSERKPISKFFWLGLMVFFYFARGGFLKVLVATGLVESDEVWGKELQTMVLLQMAGFACIQLFTYSPDPYSPLPVIFQVAKHPPELAYMPEPKSAPKPGLKLAHKPMLKPLPICDNI